MTRILILLLTSVVLSGCTDSDNSQEFSLTSPALVAAAEENRIEDIKTLLQQDTNVDASDECGWTALMKAALYGHQEIAELLLQHGATVDLQDKGGYTALLLAASNNHEAVAERLLRSGASINHQELTRGWTALIWAAKRGHVQTVQRLLENHADKTISDFNGKTAIDWARQEKKQPVARLLQ